MNTDKQAQKVGELFQVTARETDQQTFRQTVKTSAWSIKEEIRNGKGLYFSSSSCRRLLTVWALFSRVILCRRKKVCWNMRNRYSSKSIGTQFFDMSSLTQVIARTPSRARSTLLSPPCCTFCPPPFKTGGTVPALSCPLVDEELVEMNDPVFSFVLRSQPNRAKWKMDASRVGVMFVDRGIQLNRWAKHSRTRQQSCWLSLSRAAIGWQSNFEYWLPWNRVPSSSTGRWSRRTHSLHPRHQSVWGLDSCRMCQMTHHFPLRLATGVGWRRWCCVCPSKSRGYLQTSDAKFDPKSLFKHLPSLTNDDCSLVLGGIPVHSIYFSYDINFSDSLILVWTQRLDRCVAEHSAAPSDII